LQNILLSFQNFFPKRGVRLIAESFEYFFSSKRHQLKVKIIIDISDSAYSQVRNYTKTQQKQVGGQYFCLQAQH